MNEMARSPKNFNRKSLVALLRHPRRVLRNLTTERAGAVVVIVAIAMVPLLLAAGGIIDFARFYVTKGRVQFALDEALLAAGASDPSADRKAIFDNYLAKNYSGTLNPPPTHSDFSDPTLAVFTASVDLSVPTVFLQLAAINNLTTTISSQIIRTATGLELALVLDSTGSMIRDGSTKLDEMKAAATALLDIVYEGQPTSTTARVAVVPFVTTVNIGNTNDIYLSPHWSTYDYPTNLDTSWKGCVMARGGGNDVLDTYSGGTGDDGKWEPYFWEAESYYKNNANKDESSCPNTWWRSNDGYIDFALRPTGRPTDLKRFADPEYFNYDVGTGFTDTALAPLPDPSPEPGVPAGNIEGETRGPNKGCPSPITPLSDVRATAQAGIDAMQGFFAGGTAIPMGAVWGWRVLSPGAPFTQGVAYGTPNINKVMIILTDGENGIDDINGGIFGDCRQTHPAPTRYNSQYTGYGYLSDGRLGTSTLLGDAKNELNNRLATVCTNIKNAGITIFAITFGDDADNVTVRAQMEACASLPSYYYHAPDGAQLQTAFRAIGAILTNLRIAQ